MPNNNPSKLFHHSPFQEGTMYIQWGRGTLDFDLPPSVEYSSLNISESDVNMMQLLRADKITIPEKRVLSTDIKLNDVEIPSTDTTYFCKIQKLPPILQQRKHHIVQFEPIINSSVDGHPYMFTHHMEVFHCEAPADVEIPEYNGDCTEMPEAAQVCKRVISLWAMGASVFTYPPEAGLPIGGRDYNPFIRIEVHFNNPELLEGGRDSSGMRIRFVETLRKNDAQVMELGLEYTDKMAIPPGQVGFPLSGYCIPECTGIALPKNGITVFGSQLHAHLRGVRILTRHLRDGRELRELNRDDYYSHHFQEIRQLRRKPRVLPGDALVTTCYYDTQGYKNATLGGFSIQDEMCVNYIHYYPATDLELCKSSVSEGTLNEYFDFMRSSERQRVTPGGARSENYKAIRWTDTRVMELFAVYTQEPLSMQCNRSDGFRFEGYEWEGAPSTRVTVPLLPTGDPHCDRENFEKKPIEDGLCDLLGDCIY